MTGPLPAAFAAEVRSSLRDLRSARLASAAWAAVAGDLGRLAVAAERGDEPAARRALEPLHQVAFESKIRGRLASADRRAAVVSATKPTSSLPLVGALCAAILMVVGYALGGWLVLAGTAVFGLFIFGVAVAGTRTNLERTEDRRARRASPTREALEPAPPAVRAAIEALESQLAG